MKEIKVKPYLLWISICLGVIILIMLLTCFPEKKCLEWGYQEQKPLLGLSLGVSFNPDDKEISNPKLNLVLIQQLPKQVCVKEE